jgi:hypothetical protein
VAILERGAPLGQAVRETMDHLVPGGVLGMVARSLWFDSIVDPQTVALPYLHF